MLSQPSVMRDTFSFMPAFLLNSLFTVSTLQVASISLSIVLYDDEEQAEYFVVYDGDIYIMMQCVSVCNEKWALS